MTRQWDRIANHSKANVIRTYVRICGQLFALMQVQIPSNST